MSYHKAMGNEPSPEEVATATLDALESRAPDCIYYNHDDRCTCHDHRDPSEDRDPNNSCMSASDVNEEQTCLQITK